jgi:hypothetical protein
MGSKQPVIPGRGPGACLTAAAAIFFILAFTVPAAGQVLIDDFEDVSDWSGLARDTTLVMEGSASGLWSDTVGTTAVRKDFAPPLDASPYGVFAVWIHSHAANGAQLQLVFDSDNEADPEGWDYYSRELTVDWEGWKYLRLPLAEIGASRSPLGWDTINYVAFNASGWDHEPLPDTQLNFDAMIVGNGAGRITAERYAWDGADFLYEYDIRIDNATGAPHVYGLSWLEDTGLGFEYALSQTSFSIPAGEGGTVTASIRIPAALITADNLLLTEFGTLVIAEDATPVDAISLRATVPLPARDHPALMLDAADAERINTWAGSYAWAADRRDGILADADGWPADYEATYGLGAWALPPEGGQWSLWYVCPDDNVYLEYRGPGQHVCPVCGRSFTGWPYDQVIYGRMHEDLADSALRLGQAYLLTGTAAYAEACGEILLAYADGYRGYPIHDINGDEATSGARVLAQTLDESGWLIDIAWAYDLIQESGALSDTEKAHVEADLLREGAWVIGRNDAGESNWQSWHNAAVGAVGFTLDDPRLISNAWNHGSGYLFQMAGSVSGDGFWYEGSWGYHFYALRPLSYTAEMAMRGGLDPLAGTPLLAMFTAPVGFAEPDGGLPAFNDSGRSTLSSQRGLYEIAYGWTGDGILAVPLDPASRPLEALLWGAEEVGGASTGAAGESVIFPDSGYAVMRAGMDGEDPVYLALDYGPHGGWHGHYDKLGFAWYALGMEAALDPGTHSYALAIHDGYDRATVAHNTVVVDMKSQVEASGELLGSVFLPDASLSKAGAGGAYVEASLTREMLVTDRYVVDRFEAATLDGASHGYDWVIHGRGELVDAGAGTPVALGDEAGYGWLEDARERDGTLPARLTWNFSDQAGSEAGSWWGSESGIDAAFTVSTEQAASGSASGKMHYDFSAATGYVIFSVDAPASAPADAAPTGLSVEIYGDGSGNGLSLRLYDSTDERFVFDAGLLDFTGWRSIDAADPAGWSHYLGNDDGIFDPPVNSIGVELSQEAGGSSVSDIFIDDIELRYGDTVLPVKDFEVITRYVNLVVPPETGEGGLSIVTGLGPTSWAGDAPFVMLRKSGTAATFVTLLQPSRTGAGDEAALEVLSPSACGGLDCRGYLVEHALFSDAAFWDSGFGPGSATIEMTGSGGETFSTDGRLGLCRSEGTTPSTTRMGLAAGSSLTCRDLRLLECSSPALRMQVDVLDAGLRVDVFAELALASQIRILAPLAQTAWLNGTETAFVREGDYIIINALPTPEEGAETPDGAEWPDGYDGASDAGSDGEEGEGSPDGCGCSLVV